MTPSPASAKPAPPQLTLRARIDAYERLLRLDKPIGTLLLLWPTLSALWLASFGYAPFALVVVFAMGTLLMRSAGCAFNDWADRDVDAHVKRTADRPLAAGVIAPWEALAIAAALSLIAFVLVLSTNRATVLWSIPALAIAIAYPFFKRFFAVPQAFLGIAFSFGIPMAYAAIYKGVPLIAWLLLLVNGFWVMAYDTEYAMVDRDDDVRVGIRTSAIAFGRYDIAVVAACYALYVAGMAGIGYWLQLGPIYFAGLVVAAAIAAYHVWLIRDRAREACFRAFLHNHWLGLTVFVAVALDYAVRQHAWPRNW